MPLVNSLFKINDCECEFDFYELHSWLKLKYTDKEDSIHLWETLLPLFSFPKTHQFSSLISWCQARYDLVQRIVMTQDGKIMITITAHSINQMLMIPPSNSLSHFSPTALMYLYNKLTFPQRALLFELFLP